MSAHPTVSTNCGVAILVAGLRQADPRLIVSHPCMLAYRFTTPDGILHADK